MPSAHYKPVCCAGLPLLLAFTLLWPGIAATAEETQATVSRRVSDGRGATLQALPEPPAGALGFPDRSANLDALPGFRQPPNGYAPVPLYLWTGDTLTRERLAWQLDRLAQGGIQGVTVFYNHTHRGVDHEFNRGFLGPFGRLDPGDPPAFSDPWWDLWKWFSAECVKRGMGVGFLDYGFAFRHSGYWPDEIRARPEFETYRGRVQTNKVADLRGAESFVRAVDPDRAVALTAYPVIADRIDVAKALDLLDLVQDAQVRWTAPAGEDSWRVFESVAVAEEAHMLHPNHGQEWINRYFQHFEDRMDDDARKGMNYGSSG